MRETGITIYGLEVRMKGISQAKKVYIFAFPRKQMVQVDLQDPRGSNAQYMIFNYVCC